MGKAHLYGCIHDRTLCVGFFLCKSSSKCETHFRLIVQCIDMLSLKEDFDGRRHGREHANDADAIYNVSSETRYALCNNEIYFPCLAVCNHTVKGITLLK